MAALREIGQGLIDPKYCCCAIPLVNFGIYAILSEQMLVSGAIGVVAVVAPKVIGTSYPSWVIWIFAITCWIVAGIQPIGFIGVLREKTKTFRVYSTCNMIAIFLAFGASAALIIVSAVNHNSAVSTCIKNFFTPDSTNTQSANNMLQQQGPILCSPFAWADVGIMGGLWVLLALVQGYFIYLTRGYSTSQIKDHKLYHSVYSENPEAFTMSVLQSKRYNPNSVYSTGNPRMSVFANQNRGGDDAWDHRMSSDVQDREELNGLSNNPYNAQYGQHPQAELAAGGMDGMMRRDESFMSGKSGNDGRYDDAGYDQYNRNSGFYDQPPQQHHHQQQLQYNQHEGGYGGYQEPYQNTHHQQQYSNGSNYPPSYATEYPQQVQYGREPGPTPTLNQYNDGQGVGFSGGGEELNRPGAARAHPAEGMFGRKSPRGYQ